MADKKQIDTLHMGAGASALPATIDKQTALSLAGADFDETAFDAAAKNGVVAKHDFLAAAERVRPTDTTSKCAALFTAFNECMDKAIAAEATNEEAAKVATDAFWEGQARQSCWVVPMGDESTFTRHCGLLVALERARAAGKTPLLVDNSEDSSSLTRTIRINLPRYSMPRSSSWTSGRAWLATPSSSNLACSS